MKTNALRLFHFKSRRNSSASANSFRQLLKRKIGFRSKRFKKMKILTRLDFERKGNLQLFKMIEVLRRLSKIINVRSALAVALAKSVGSADILHNSSYSYENIITRRRQPLKGFLLL